MAHPYLLLYNSALCVAWAYCLYITYMTVAVHHGGPAELWKAVALPLKIAQTAALLEVVHSAVGLVRSPVAITATQVASRQWVLWGLIVPLSKATTGRALTLGHIGGVPLQLSLITLVTAWGLSEVIRYSFFAFKELGTVPYPSLWLRYTAFLVLYPIGVASELTIAWLALPAIKDRKLWTLSLPNPVNWGFDYHIACILVMLTYLPGLPMLYGYMLTQRKKVLRPAKAKAQ